MAQNGSSGGPSPRTITVIMYVITAAWVGTIVAEIFVKDFETPGGVNEAMMAMVGFLFAGRQAAIARQKEDSSDGS